MTSRTMAVATAVLALFAGACSPRTSHRPPVQAPAPRVQSETPEARLSRADGLVDRGCYLCLQDARAVYQDLLTAGFQPAAMRDRLFRAAALLVARERELGIVPPTGGEPTRPEVPDTASLPYADVAASIPWPTTAILGGLPGSSRPGMAPLAAWRAQLTPPADAGDPLAAYMLVALDCTFGPPSPSPGFGRFTAAHPASLGLAFRVAICRPVNEPVLRDVVAREPRFVEADYVLGEQCARRGEAEEAEQHLRRAMQQLPRLIAAPIALGGVLADGEEFEAALDAYDRALATSPGHRQALLGRARCLSNLERHQEALAACDTLIRMGEWYLGPAYYWRAWNLHAVQDLQGASEAIRTAKGYLQTADVFDLAGAIEFDRGDVGQARADLREALRRDPNICRARFYLGRLDADAGQWMAAGVGFAQAMDCYAAGAGRAAMRLEEVRRSTTLPDVRRARLVERCQRQIANGEHAAALAAYHAALSYANAGLPAVAIEHAERALGDDQLKTQVQELLAKLRKSSAD